MSANYTRETAYSGTVVTLDGDTLSCCIVHVKSIPTSRDRRPMETYAENDLGAIIHCV